MGEYEKLLIKNTAVLLLTANYMSVKQTEASRIIAKALVEMKKLDKEAIDIMIEHSRYLFGRTEVDRKIIQIAVDDLYYLKKLKGEWV